jgi:hypothetical protein
MNNNKKPTETVKMATSKLGQKGASAALKKAATGINAAEVVMQIVTAYNDWKKVAEEEKTKRHAISAEERRAIHQINVQRDLLMTHLERSFDERRENFRQFFDSLDRAIDKGDTAIVAATLTSIVELAQSSPFRDIASVQAVRDVIADQDTVYEI